MIGSYARANASADTNWVETDAGNFVSFQIAHFFSGLSETISSSAKTDYWRGSARAEINLLPNIDLTGGWTQRSRTLDGSALISSLYLDAVTYAGVKRRGPVEHDQRDDVRRAQGHNLRRHGDGPADRSPGGQCGLVSDAAGRHGHSRRDRDRRSGRPGRTVSAHTQHVRRRTDLLAKRGSRWAATTGATKRTSRSCGRTSSIGTATRFGLLGLDGHGTHRSQLAGEPRQRRRSGRDRVQHQGARSGRRSGGLALPEGADAARLRGRVQGGPQHSHSPVPQDFTIDSSAQKELGHTWEGGVTWVYQRLTLDAGYLWFQNGGSIPFTVDRARVRAEVGLECERRLGGRMGARQLRRDGRLRPGRAARQLPSQSVLPRIALEALGGRSGAYDSASERRNRMRTNVSRLGLLGDRILLDRLDRPSPGRLRRPWTSRRRPRPPVSRRRTASFATSRSSRRRVP